MPEANAPALAALAKAVALKASASAEGARADRGAASKRYSADPKAERAGARRRLCRRDEGRSPRASRPTTRSSTLYAEAAMDTQPWDYWEAGGAKPKGRGAEIVATLETVLKRNPDAPGRDPPLHPRGRGVDHAGARAAARRPPRRADARRRPHRAHAGAHLLPRRPCTASRSTPTSARSRSTSATSRPRRPTRCTRRRTTRTTSTS